MEVKLTAAHRRRLREVWRSAGWPYQDLLEVELLAVGLLERRHDAEGRATVSVTDAGVHELAATLQRNRAARDAHEALVEHVAREMQRAGRIVWRGLSLRAPVSADDGSTSWVMAMPDVFSVRHTTVEDYLQPVVHEIKVRRADLLADLRRPAKGLAYRALAGECWYVIAQGIGQADEIPDEYGVLEFDGERLEVRRQARARALKLPFGVWMALARAAPDAAGDVDDQEPLRPPAPG